MGNSRVDEHCEHRVVEVVEGVVEVKMSELRTWIRAGSPIIAGASKTAIAVMNKYTMTAAIAGHVIGTLIFKNVLSLPTPEV